MDNSTHEAIPPGSITLTILHVLTGSSTSDNLDQFTGNGGLTLSVVQDLEPVDHITSVLGSVLSS
jgi:hypothetical protein